MIGDKWRCERGKPRPIDVFVVTDPEETVEESYMILKCAWCRTPLDEHRKRGRAA